MHKSSPTFCTGYTVILCVGGIKLIENKCQPACKAQPHAKRHVRAQILTFLKAQGGPKVDELKGQPLSAGLPAEGPRQGQPQPGQWQWR